MTQDSKYAGIKPRGRQDFKRLKHISPMSMVEPFVMKTRIGSMNLMDVDINVLKLESYVKEKQEQGYADMSIMYVLIAAYVRLVSQRPKVNRFIRGQRHWTRKSVEVALTIKKEMTLESPDTVVKIVCMPDDTIFDVYNKLDKEIKEYRNSPGGDFDKTAKLLAHIPALFMRWFIGFANLMDYLGILPQKLQEVSPFHCSFFITSLGSLGIPPCYHHLYNFGTCPAFCAFGVKRRKFEIDSDGLLFKKRYMTLKFSVDERICDGFYLSSAFRMYNNILKNPYQLETPPEKIIDDDEV